MMRKLNNSGRNISIKGNTGRDIASEAWDRTNLGGHRERDKQLFAFEAALLIADELTAGKADI